MKRFPFGMGLAYFQGLYLGVEPKIGGFLPPKSSIEKIGLEPWTKPSILGVSHPYFWKHPYVSFKDGVWSVIINLDLPTPPRMRSRLKWTLVWDPRS